MPEQGELGFANLIPSERIERSRRCEWFKRAGSVPNMHIEMVVDSVPHLWRRWWQIWPVRSSCGRVMLRLFCLLIVCTGDAQTLKSALCERLRHRRSCPSWELGEAPAQHPPVTAN
jgi:hypothetical protein